MDEHGIIRLIVLSAFMLGLPADVKRRRALRRYWTRPCMGIRWRRRFPDVSKDEIRDFLNLFVDAFGHRRKKRHYFSPDDRVMEIHKAQYPPGVFHAGDCLELETLAIDIEKRYRIDFLSIWTEEHTLGELFERARTQAH